MKLRMFKTVLWFLAGMGLLVVLLRILHGVGSVVALNDVLPWGLWKGGGVVALVPIGGAGFTVAALVYVFHLKRFEPVARGAVLLGLMCYGSVAVGLTFDIGIWWRIVFPVVFWQPHSTLFEIAWCIMLYLGVLVVEFSHAVFERLKWVRLSKLAHRVSIVFVILGICLSTLHQSSLGTLFLATPFRLHPLWYSGILPLLFFITAIGLGCLTISWVTLLVHWLYDREPPMRALSGLARISSVVLGAYLVLRVGDLLVAGKASLLVSPGWDTANFWLEIALSALLPVVLLARRSLREHPTALFWISTAAIVGMSLNRVNVAGLATLSLTEGSYFPIWPEWAVTFGLLSAAGLFFLFCVEQISVFASIDGEAVERARAPARVDPANWRTTFFRTPLADVRLYSAVVLVAVTVGLLLLPDNALYGARPDATPTRGPRVVQMQRVEAPDATGKTRFVFPVEAGNSAPAVQALLIDGDANGRYVLFDHKRHAALLKERGQTCSECHHMTGPLAEASSCQTCHSDMHLERDIFDHRLHEERLGDNDGCAMCHSDPALEKTRKSVTLCEKCHPGMRHESTLVSTGKRGPEGQDVASGYMNAMHGLCASCHEQEVKQGRVATTGFAECASCHRDTPQLSELVQHAQNVHARGANQGRAEASPR